MHVTVNSVINRGMHYYYYYFYYYGDERATLVIVLFKLPVVHRNCIFYLAVTHLLFSSQQPTRYFRPSSDRVRKLSTAERVNNWKTYN
jgi:hypothetical protein